MDDGKPEINTRRPTSNAHCPSGLGREDTRAKLFSFVPERADWVVHTDCSEGDQVLSTTSNAFTYILGTRVIHYIFPLSIKQIT